MLGAISLDLFAVLLGGATALLPIFAKDVLHVGPWGLGLLRGAPAVGALAMSLALARWPIRRRTGPRLLAAVAVFGVAIVVFGGSTDVTLSLAALAVGGAADMVSVVIRQTLVQLETPDACAAASARSTRCSSAPRTSSASSSPAPPPRGSGRSASVVLGGIGTCLVAVAWWRLFPDLARRDRLLADTPSAPRR